MSTGCDMDRLVTWLRARLGGGLPWSVLALVAVLLVGPGWLAWLQIHPATPITAAASIELKDFIVKVKSDLQAAEMVGVQKGERPLLKLQDVQLVTNFVVRTSSQGDIKLVAVNGTALAGVERSQQITLHLTPIADVTTVVAPSSKPIAEAGSVVLGPTPPQESKTR